MVGTTMVFLAIIIMEGDMPDYHGVSLNDLHNGRSGRILFRRFITISVLLNLMNPRVILTNNQATWTLIRKV